MRVPDLMSGGAHQRPALVSILGHLGPGSVAMVAGLYGSGRGTLARQWIAARGYSALWWNTARAVPGAAEVAASGSPDVVVIRLHDGGAHDAASIRACRDGWPTAILLVISAYGWPEELRSGPLRPEVAIAGHDLAFTAEQTRAWAGELGVSISAVQAAEVVAATGGYAVVVDAVVRRAAAAGRYDREALVRGCDDAVADLAAAASAGVVPWDLWEVSVLTASAGELSAGAMEALWARAREGTAALRTMRDSGVIMARADGKLVMARGILAASRRRLGTDAPPVRHERIVGPLLDEWAASGRLDDAMALIGTPAFDSARAELMARHWEHLAELPAAIVRERLTGLGPHSDPHLLVAMSRALIDVTHEGHTGSISPADRARAATLLTESGSAAELSGAGKAMAAALEAINFRAAGHHDRAHAEAARSLTNPELPATVRPAVTLQAGLSAMSVGALPTAAERFAEAAQLSREAGQVRIGTMAAELEVLVHVLHVGPVSSSHRPHGLGATADPAWPKVARLIRLINAVRAVDVEALLDLRVDDVGAVTVDDPAVLDLYEWCYHAMALQLLGRPSAALVHTELLQAAFAGHALSDFGQRMLVLARAEALAAAGEPSTSLELLAEHHADPDHRHEMELLRARAEIASGEHVRALARLRRVVGGHDRGSARQSVWGNVLLSTAHRNLGADREADRFLEAALVAGARSSQRQPFAWQGRAELSRLIAHADRLDLGSMTRRFVADLASTRDALRSATTPVMLTNRERLLLEHLVRIEGVRRLANELHVSQNTVKSQLRTLYRKLEVSSRAEAIKAARAMRLVSDA